MDTAPEVSFFKKALRSDGKIAAKNLLSGYHLLTYLALIYDNKPVSTLTLRINDD